MCLVSLSILVSQFDTIAGIGTGCMTLHALDPANYGLQDC